MNKEMFDTIARDSVLVLGTMMIITAYFMPATSTALSIMIVMIMWALIFSTQNPEKEKDDGT